MLRIEVKAPSMTSITAGIEKAMLDAVNFTLDAVEKDFQSSLQHFVHKPTFTKERATIKPNEISGQVFTNDENYARLNNGTASHPVGAGRLMRFLGYDRTLYGRSKATSKMKGVKVYKPKSIPGQIASVPGFPMGGTTPIVRRGPWTVAGIDPRQYDLLIRDKNQPVLEAALTRFLKAR